MTLFNHPSKFFSVKCFNQTCIIIIFIAVDLFSVKVKTEMRFSPHGLLLYKVDTITTRALLFFCKHGEIEDFAFLGIRLMSITCNVWKR